MRTSFLKKMSVILQNVVVVLLFTHAFALLEIANPELEDDSSGYTSVRFLGGRSHEGRRKRAVGECFHDVLSFTVTVDGIDTTLQLVENTKIDLTRPVLVADDAGVFAQTVPSLVETRCFQDFAHDAAIGVTYSRLPEGGCRYFLEGTFSDAHGACVIQPSGRRQGEPEDHVVRRMNSTIDFFGDFVVEDDGMTVDTSSSEEHEDGGKRPKFRRSKRQAVLHEIELFLVIDSLVYDFWLARVNGSTAEIKRANALDAINRYYAYIVNGLDMRYQSIADEDLAFSVLNSGLYVATTAALSPFTTAISTENPDNPERPLVNASDVLSTLQTFVRDNGALLKPSDHTMLFSKADFFRESDGSRDLAGRAFLSRTCTDASVSFSEDLFNFITITIASHELGHCMGAGHDGPDNACFAEDSFIMAPSSQPVLGEKARNPWRFSNCSLEYFRTYVNTLDDAGTNCLLTRDPGFDPSAVDGYLAVEPGQFYSIDEQCRYSRGEGSYLCRALFDADTYPEVCKRAWCAIPNDTNCGSMVPARGTSCGDSKWCVESQCTTDPNAPTVLDACPFGDQPGEILDGVTCQDITAIDCYQSSWANRCCQTCANFETGNPDCLYGDRNIGCATILRQQCYSNEAVCCGLCPPLKASNQIGCEFGDRATGCSAMSCAGYDNATLLLCCETCQVFSTTPATTTVMTTTAITETTTTSMPTTSTVETTTTALPTTTTAETTTTAMPTTTTVETTTTAIPTTTTAETTTNAMPTTTTVETTTTAIPTTTTAETTTTAMPTTTVETTTTAIPTTTTAETTTTVIPTTTTAETITTAMPTTTTAETTTTAMPTTTTAETTTTAIPTTTTAGTTTTAMPTTTTVETTTTAMPTTTTAETTTTAMPTTTTAETTTTAMPTTTTAETTTTAMPTTITAETTTTAMPTTTTAETTTTAMPTTTTAETTTTTMTTTAERESTRADGCVDSGGLPFSFSLDMGGLCDTSQDDCTVTTIHLSPRTPVDNIDSLTCHFRQILVDEVGSRLTGSFTAGPGLFVRCDAVQCRVPGGEIPFADGRRVFGWLVSVSNDGVAYGSEVVYLPFNGRCVSCNTQNPPVCTWDASYCYVAGECYADGLVNPLNPCEQCDSAGSPTAWAIAADTCAIGGGCVANGALNPDDNCQVCDAQESQTGFSIRRGVCNIGGRCYRDGEGNPDSACQSCDLTSPTTWKTSTVTLLGGGEAPCEDFCRYLVLYMPHHLDDVICKLGGLADSLIERVCAVEDPMAVPELNCPGTASILPRYLAFCGHTVYEAARVDPVVCPR